MFNRRLHHLLILLILLCTAAMRLYVINLPFESTAEGVGSWYGLMARNYLRLPFHIHKGVPVQSICPHDPANVQFYSHHPPLVPLTIAASYKLFGEGDWQTRLPAVLSTFGSILLLYLLLKPYNPPAALYAAAIFSALPMTLYYGGQPEFLNPQFIFFTLLATYAFFQLNQNPTIKSLLLLCASFAAAAATDWPTFYLVPLCILFFIARHKSQHLPFIILFTLFATLLFAALYAQITLVATHDWAWMLHHLRTRSVGATPTQKVSLIAWLKKAWEYNFTHHTLPILLLSAFWLLRGTGILPVSSPPSSSPQPSTPPSPIPNRKSQIANPPTLFLLLFALIHLLIGRQGSYAHAWWWWPLTPFLVLSSALALSQLIHKTPPRLRIPAHALACTLLLLFFTHNLKKTLPQFLDPHLTSANTPSSGPTLARAVRFAAPNSSDCVLLISGDIHPSLWYYADRPIKMHIWSIDDFHRRLTDTTLDLPYAFQHDNCPTHPTAIIIPKLYSNAAKDLLTHLRAHYPQLNPPTPISDLYEIFQLPAGPTQ